MIYLVERPEKSYVPEIIIGVLTVLGTAFATFLAAKYTGKNANKIADENNEHQRILQQELLKEENLNHLLIAYNQLYYYIESFYDEHNDQVRINALNAEYDWINVKDQNQMQNYIIDSSLTLIDLNNLGSVVVTQAKDINNLESDLNNNLLKCKKYFEVDDFNNLDQRFRSIIEGFKYVLRDGTILSGTENISIRGMAINLIHLYNRSTFISYYFDSPNMDDYKDGKLMLNIPALMSYKSCCENNKEIKMILSRYLDII
jgi:hypothetical protein